MVSRLSHGQRCLDIEGAREVYLGLLGQAAERFDTSVLAYCLMSCHVHLVLELGADRLGSFARAVHSPFANWLSARVGTKDPVFAERPRSVIVDRANHGAELIRYVHNNPVRAALVERAAQCPWSSHRAYLGLDEPPPWLALDALLGPQGPQRPAARDEFAAFVDEGRFEPRRRDFSRGASRAQPFAILGPEDFVVAAIRARASQPATHQSSVGEAWSAAQLRDEVFEALGLDPESSAARARSRARALVAWLWIERLARPQSEVARALGVKPSAVCKIMAKLRKDGVNVKEALVIDDVLKAKGA
jgi:hypothetical protein